MALSLVCKDCNAMLKSVAEAQTHNEVTGHTNFEESTEPVRDLMIPTLKVSTRLHLYGQACPSTSSWYSCILKFLT